MLLTVLVLLVGLNDISGLELAKSSRNRGMRKETKSEKPGLNVGLIVPFSNFLKKQYEKNVGAAVSSIKKKKYLWSNTYLLTDEQVHLEMMSINPSPTGGCMTGPESRHPTQVWGRLT